MRMRVEDLIAAVHDTLGDRAPEYDIPALVEELRTTYGSAHIDTIPMDDYWAIVRRHEISDRH